MNKKRCSCERSAIIPPVPLGKYCSPMRTVLALRLDRIHLKTGPDQRVISIGHHAILGQKKRPSTPFSDESPTTFIYLFTSRFRGKEINQLPQKLNSL